MNPMWWHELVKAVRDAVPAHIPVSAKMRLGYLDEAHTLDNAFAVQAAGANWLTVHARTKADGYTPPAYWEKILPIVDALDINVIANGEIWNNQDARACLAQSGSQDLMLGRGRRDHARFKPDDSCQSRCRTADLG